MDTLMDTKASLRKLILEAKVRLPESLIAMEALDAPASIATLELASRFQQEDADALNSLFRGKIIGTLFYQPSTRTKFSFESAAQRLGMGVTGFADPATTRAGDFYKESLEDVIRFTSELVDLIVLRHPQTGSTQVAVKNSVVPIISAGDGYGQHPTQALGDLFTMQQCLGPLSEKTIGMIGDANLRTLKAVSLGLATIGVKRLVYLLPRDKAFPDELRLAFNARSITFDFVDHVDDLLGQVDLVESIGMNHPYRNAQGQLVSPAATDKEAHDISWYQLSRAALEKVRDRPMPYVMHPGPRTDELLPDVDKLPCARYFHQTRAGMWVRMALIAALCP